MVTKTELHELVEQLPDAGVECAARYLKSLRDDPLVAMLDAAPPDEPKGETPATPPPATP